MAASRKSIASLARLNRQAHDRAFSVEDIDWSRSVDHDRPWLPESLELLSSAPSYGFLEDAQRRRCNQLAALGLCEQFILFEQTVIRALPAVLARSDLPSELRESLRCFIVEESKHIEMFWRLLERSEPELYSRRVPRLASLSGVQRFIMNRAVEYPRHLLAWIWLTIFLEERTLFVSRQYLEARCAAPDSIDPLHTQVHAFHFMDEVRHCQIDQHLLNTLYDPQPEWKKKLCGTMFHRALRAFVFPGRTARRILRMLGSEFPRLRERTIPALLTELPHIGGSMEFHRRFFSNTALPRTLALLSQYPELAAARRLLPISRSAPVGAAAGITDCGR